MGQAPLRLLRVPGLADDADHEVDEVLRDEQTFHHVQSGLRLVELEATAAGDHVPAMADEADQDVAQAQRARLPAVNREEHDSKGGGERRLRHQVVHHHAGDGVPLQLHDDAHAGAVGLVPDVADALELLLPDELGNLLDQPRLVHLIRNLGDDDALAVVLLVDLDFGARAHGDGAAAGLIRAVNPLPPADEARGGEVWTGDELHQLGDGGVGVVDEVQRPVDDLAEVVRRDVGRHPDRDSRASVHEQVWKLRRQHRGLDDGVIVVGGEVDGVLLDVREELLGEPVHPDFGVAHGRRAISVHAAEVALPVDEQMAQAPRLGEPDHGVVDGRVSVGVVLAEDVTDHARALFVGAVVEVREVVHREQNAPVHGLQAVADVGQRAPHDDGHGVVEIRLAHLVFDVDQHQVPGVAAAVQGTGGATGRGRGSWRSRGGQDVVSHA